MNKENEIDGLKYRNKLIMISGRLGSFWYGNLYSRIKKLRLRLASLILGKLPCAFNIKFDSYDFNFACDVVLRDCEVMVDVEEAGINHQ